MLGADAVFCDGLLGAMLFSDREIGEAVHHPLWTPDGSRLFYFQGASNAVAVDITTGARRWRYGVGLRWSSAPAPDGQATERRRVVDPVCDGPVLFAVFSAELLGDLIDRPPAEVKTR